MKPLSFADAPYDEKERPSESYALVANCGHRVRDLDGCSCIPDARRRGNRTHPTNGNTFRYGRLIGGPVGPTSIPNTAMLGKTVFRL
jgi:hypothetical protein